MARRRSAFLVLTAALALASACASPPPPAGETADEVAEFHQDLRDDIGKIETFLQKTRHGTNLSEFNLGWFAMILLNELCSHDQALFDYIHTGDMNVEFYLRYSFQANPSHEIATLDGMAKRTGSSLQLAARDVLEMLTRIPKASDSSEIQAQTRTALGETLTRLRASLTRVVDQPAPSL